MMFTSLLGHARWKLPFLGVLGYLFVACSGMMTEPVAEVGPRPGLAATTYTTSGRLSLGSHTNLLDWGADDDFEGSVGFEGALVRLRNANGQPIQQDSTNSVGEFHLQTSSVPARLEFVLSDGSTYTVALGSAEVGNTVVRSKLEYEGSDRVINAELIPDDDLNAVSDNGMVTQVFDRIAGVPTSGFQTTTAEEQVEATVRELEAIVLAHPGTALADKIEDALEKTRRARDELAKTPPDKQAAVNTLEGAVGDLEAAVKDRLLDATTGTRLMEQLTVASRQLATDTLDRAIAGGRYPDVIGQSQRALAEGDAYRAAGQFKAAINRYREALSKAESALS